MWRIVDDVCDLGRGVWINPDKRVWEQRSGEFLRWVGTNPGRTHPFPTGISNVEEYVVYALLMNSINYCYWYGWDKIRPNGSRASMVSNILIKEIEATKGYGCPEDLYTAVLDKFRHAICFARMPMLEERIHHLEEMGKPRTHFIRFMIEIIKKGERVGESDGSADNELSTLMNMLEQSFPGYVSDMFLKRASLFFLDLFKCRRALGRMDLFGTEVVDLPVPIDYHIPNVLRNLGLLKYSQALEMKIEHGQLIPKGSKEEVMIRANSAKICRKLALTANVSASDVDEYLYTQRSLPTTPFHLTITTDY
jgi:hypothetical protein